MSFALADLPLLASVKETAKVLGLTDGQVRGLLREGRIAFVRVGARLLVPRDAIQQFIIDFTVSPCRDETVVLACTSSKNATATTLDGQSAVAAGSAARAQQIAEKLKSRFQNSFASEPEQMGRVIPLKS